MQLAPISDYRDEDQGEDAGKHGAGSCVHGGEPIGDTRRRRAMTALVNPVTGEVETEDDRPDMLVPLNLAHLNEADLTDLFPSAVQVNGALHIARTRLGHAPIVLDQKRRALAAAKRDLTIAHGLAYVRAVGAEHLRKQIALTDEATVAAQEHVDECWLALQYAVDLKSALYQDIELLRSINANVRSEMAG